MEENGYWRIIKHKSDITGLEYIGFHNDILK